MALINCPSCSGQSRVPDDRGRILVTCPHCRHRWNYPVAIEHATVPMLCSSRKQHFHVHFRRESTRKFLIAKTVIVPAIAPVSHLLRLGVVGNRAAPPVTTSFDADEFDFWGFQCPCCHASGQSGYLYIRCSACSELACDGTMEVTATGHYFRCPCGSAGYMTGGSIRNITADHQHVVPNIGTPSQPQTKINLSSPSPSLRLPGHRYGGA